jgi:hypothetical protein
MEDIIIFTSYVVLLCLMCSKLYLNLKNGWNIEIFFIFLIILFYIFIPITMISYDYLIVEEYVVPDLKINYTDKKYYSFMSLFAVIIFLVFFYIGKSIAVTKEKNLYTIKTRSVKFGFFNFKLITMIGYFFSLLSLLSLLLYISQFGSLENAIVSSNLVRSGYGEEVFVSTKYVFVKRFIYFSLLSVLIYFFIDKRRNILHLTFLFIIPLVVTLLSNIFLFSGKQSIIIILLLILFYFSLKNKKPYLNLFLIFSMSMIFLLPFLDYIFALKSNYYNKDFNNSFSFIEFLGYFSFPQVSLQFSINNNYNYFLFNDFIYGLKGTILPFSWLEDWKTDTMLFNTKLFYGISNRGIVPPGLLAFAFYSFGILGVVFIGIISGYLTKKIDTIFKDIILTNENFIIFYAFAINLVYTAVRTGLPKFNFYHPVFLMFIIMIIFSFSIKKRV